MVDGPSGLQGKPPTAGDHPFGRLLAARWILAAAAAALLLLAATERLTLVEALIALAVIVAAALMPARWRSTDNPAAPAAPSRGSPTIGPPLAAIVAALPEPALVIDRQSRVLFGNAAAEALVGKVRRGEPISFTLRVPEVLEAIRLALAEGRSSRIEFTERVPVGRTLEAYVTPVVPEGSDAGKGRSDMLLLTFRDLTHQRRVDQLRADFVANASHELRTPLASLMGFIETLQGPARDDAAARSRFLAIMVDQARRMARLIDDLLSLSRIELVEHVQPEGHVDIVLVVGHVCEALSPLARERGVAIDLHKDEQELLVRGERDELIRLFENLVENALKYGAAGKRVEISIRRGADRAAEAVVTVRDFGPGIPPEHLPRLTERFYRIDVETSRAHGGTGLGLAIVKHILTRHRGRLAIESELGRGATFTVHLPLATVTARETAVSPAG